MPLHTREIMTQLTVSTGPQATSVLSLEFEDNCLNSQEGVTEKVKKNTPSSTTYTFLCQYGLRAMKLIKSIDISWQFS